MVTRIDAHFGMILAALEDPDGDGDPSDSVAEDTLVLFMSDNGGPKGPSFTALDSNGGLQGHKGSIHEGGIRVPTLVSWPAALKNHPTLKAGSDHDRVVDVSDWLPTFCELAGADAPVGLDGVSLAPLLSGKGTQRPREFLIHEAGKSASIIRKNWKLVRDDRRTALFDLEKDPAESGDLAGANPDLVGELDTLLTGEKVDEPKGFANTYHHWRGPEGGDLAAAAHWSDYLYENEGIRYLEDEGPPRDSWTARLTAGLAVARQPLTFLGLEIGGGDAPAGITVRSGSVITGRNEIRISAGGRVELNDGEVSSLRWVDIKEGGTLTGTGAIRATVYNRGTLTTRLIRIEGDYVGSPEGRLILDRGGRITIRGRADLAGRLELRGEPDLDRPILAAAEIVGGFSNPGQRVSAPSGRSFLITRAGNTIWLRSAAP